MASGLSRRRRPNQFRPDISLALQPFGSVISNVNAATLGTPGSNIFASQTGYRTFTISITTTATYTLGLGVVDAGNRQTDELRPRCWLIISKSFRNRPRSHSALPERVCWLRCGADSRNRKIILAVQKAGRCLKRRHIFLQRSTTDCCFDQFKISDR